MLETCLDPDDLRPDDDPKIKMIFNYIIVSSNAENLGFDFDLYLNCSGNVDYLVKQIWVDLEVLVAMVHYVGYQMVEFL